MIDSGLYGRVVDCHSWAGRRSNGRQ